MTEREPRLFRNWSEYMKQRQVMASAVIFKTHGWYEWQVGHAKVFGILLWYYETERKTAFKYSRVLKKQGYQRTHNYRLLKTIIEKNLLKREGNGYYKLNASEIKLIEKVLSFIKELDMVSKN